MSLSGALNSAISGLQSQGQSLANISDNLANSETTAYKSSGTSFSSLVAGSGSNSSGGVVASSTSNITQQGLLVTSTSQTDLAIDGDGFFIVTDGVSGDENFYTRNGEFTMNEDGYLVNGDYYLIGWPTDADGTVIGGTSEASLTPIDLDSIQSPVDATENVGIAATLPAEAAVGDTFTTSFEVYDSLGGSAIVNVTYEKTDVNEWEMSYADPVNANGDTVGTVSTATTTLTFDSDGNLTAPTGAQPVTITGWTTGAADSAIELTLGNDSDAFSQVVTGSDTPTLAVKSVTSDGTPYGNLSGLEIGTDGAITAFFDNGAQETVYKIPLATFTNPNGLSENSGGIYSATTAAGVSTINLAGENGSGTVNSFWLESSVTDTSDEFSRMLSAQQAYSASSQIMSAANDMFDTLLTAVR
ncbi:flagellar hook protein FlgE [Roseibium sp. RKSG952]|uniref:flagellar hook protein FlgE n=1 Tax=Roseibium sp. RKSG952 TaxID=2529384 RepID=UPI0012BC1A6F|nr:flagellar hook protein FlgE [Roseibium sp. RKSG952]MTH97456.1 flagellar hook protein FlgE [Roseibium sp. RKSG952]